jgi:hypothetical protein
MTQENDVEYRELVCRARSKIVLTQEAKDNCILQASQRAQIKRGINNSGSIRAIFENSRNV